ncbi:cullin CDC53 SCDLUD_000289 [Saccharomycodes ludwigii]|uniref:cullin CDC53 n=1 Tax=Saccharomycodes ludwigii TaxID=36035 RepID=UPI001E87A6B6|nr:hypothetical protein SCDLUD_000289 [Saccharomycodes ludwigii]KAH3902705.1 hypothetical protein SCDLUD_000289 [Saccharomycodes ludwigii]
MSELGLPKSNDLEATWNFIEPGVNKILGPRSLKETERMREEQRYNHTRTILSPTTYMDIYTAIYNYCVDKSSFSTTDQPQQQNTMPSLSRSIISGSELYFRLETHLESYLNTLEKRDNETFLQFYVRRWKRFVIGAHFLNHAFDYMNRYWVQKERSDGKRNIFNIYHLCIFIWKQIIFEKNKDLLIDEILYLITKERNLQVIDQSLIYGSIESFVTMGIDKHDLKKLNLECYIDSFEGRFLEVTEEFWSEHCKNFLSEHTVDEYIYEVERIIKYEELVVNSYLDPHTIKLSSNILNKVLIDEHKEELYKTFVLFLDAQNESSIKLLYTLLKREVNLLPRLAQIFESYVKSFGETAVSTLINETNGNVSPKDYIKCLIKVYDTFLSIAKNCFDSEVSFIKSLDNAARMFINVNEFAYPPGTPSSETSKTPEMLAKYSDLLLKRSAKNQGLVSDMSISDIMVIFKFLSEKDAFEKHYRRLFAKRLIHGTSISDVAEEDVIQRLQNENSMEYTGKITKMFQDIKLSKQLEVEFENAIKVDPDYSRTKYPEFQPFVLAETMWPFPYTKVDFQLPKDLLPTYKGLEKLYASKHNGRILKWLWPLCRGEIQADIGKEGRPPFIFTVTLFQMAILLQFNDTAVLTMGEICKKTKLSINEVINNIVPFIKLKLLQQSPPQISALTSLRTEFELAHPYKAAKSKINFANGIKSDVASVLLSQQQQQQQQQGNHNLGNLADTQDDLEETNAELDSERQVFLESCIVRILKKNGKLHHSSLVNECIVMAQERFHPKVSMIKRAIEDLISKEYIQRLEDGETYEYLA